VRQCRYTISTSRRARLRKLGNGSSTPLEGARRREHGLLTNEHLFIAFAQVEWEMFAQVMRDVELNPHTILLAIEEHLRMTPSSACRDLRVSPATKLVFRLALHHASRAGRQTIDAADLFSAVFEGNPRCAGLNPPASRRRT
jgi:ATP-dependent Clp protease ATP-binding subunit ClpA